MPKFRNFQTNFSGGLLSEGMLGRVDLAQYENGCLQLENWCPKVTGGMRRRPGSLNLSFWTQAERMESFIFNEDQTYVVLFGPDWDVKTNSAIGANIRFYDPDTGTRLDDVSTSLLFGSDATIINELSITQKADVMFLAHPSFKTQKIIRTGASTFELSDFEFEGAPPDDDYPRTMPFIKFAQAKVTAQPSAYAKGAQVGITFSEDVYPTDAVVGSAIRYRGKQILITTWVSASALAGTILEELDQGAVLQFNSATYKPHDYEIGEIIVGRDSGVKAEVLSTANTTVTVAMIAGKFAPLTVEEVEGLNSGNIAKITSFSNINPPASADWDEEAFSDLRGWPGVIEFHSQRLWLGGSSSLPAHIFGSRVAAFFNFDAGDAFPADSIQVALAGKQINQVTDIVSGRHLQVFTDKGEFYAPQSEDRPLVPETFDLIPQTRYGSKRLLEPKVFDESTLFAQAQGTAIREFLWADNQKGYSSDAISLIAEEYLNDIQEIEVLYGGYDRPEQMAFFVNGDGTITWYHSARAESIRTWGIWTTEGLYKSLAVIQDKLFALVERTINGVTHRFIERFELDITLDCATQRADTAKSVWPSAVSGIWDGHTVQIGSGVTAHDPDYYLGEFVPDGGSVDVTPIKVDNITIGLGFTQTLEPMPIEVKDQNGVTGGMPKRIVSADIYMASTLAVALNGQSITTFLGQNDLTQKPDTITGLRKFYLLGYSERPTVEITNPYPVPCEVLSLGTEVEY